MTNVLCGFKDTSSGIPCANPVGMGSAKCAAGHAVAATIKQTRTLRSSTTAPVMDALEVEDILGVAPALPILELDGYAYTVELDEHGESFATYFLEAPHGGGWKIEYDATDRTAKARCVRPKVETAETRDEGEADIRKVVKELEPLAAIVVVAGRPYLVDGNGVPLSGSELRGINSGRMALINGSSAADILADTEREEARQHELLDEEPVVAQEAVRENLAHLSGVRRALELYATQT